MIVLLILVLSSFTVSQGETFNINLQVAAEVVLPSCMFFEHTMTNREYLLQGNYSVYVSYECYGEMRIFVLSGNLSEQYSVFVRESKDFSKINEEIISIKRKILALKNENNYLKSLTEVLNKMNVDLYDKLSKCSVENLNLLEKVRTLENSTRNCASMLHEAENKIRMQENDLKELSKRLDEIEKKLEKAIENEKRAEENAKIFQLSFILAISVFTGLIFSLFRK
ncbi:MAG: hypothetical protein NZ895_06690 [Archaeoglobaceae archaeon]|nr:hypothetical protein [Archaeoglobaceae archaeon]MCX8152258.1 hypothetical protein [Archaeoglobaceae archaeon]MDW8013936.1 hypothetical protein [Archaeoglobaceae archaeon]